MDLGWRSATVKFDGIEFANPSWARDPYLVKAERAEFDIRLWPLVAQKVVIPRIALFSPALGLQMEADGRRTWAFGKDTADTGTVPTIGLMQVDGGSIDGDQWRQLGWIGEEGLFAERPQRFQVGRPRVVRIGDGGPAGSRRGTSAGEVAAANRLDGRVPDGQAVPIARVARGVPRQPGR